MPVSSKKTRLYLPKREELLFLPKCCGDLINHCRVHNLETDEARRRKQTYTSNKNRRGRTKKKKIKKAQAKNTLRALNQNNQQALSLNVSRFAEVAEVLMVTAFPKDSRIGWACCTRLWICSLDGSIPLAWPVEQIQKVAESMSQATILYVLSIVH